MLFLTLFDSLWDNTTIKKLKLDSWEQFKKLLYELSKKPLFTKKDAQLISPAIYKANTNRRKNVNVEAWAGWAAVDIDQHDFKGDIQQEVIAKYGMYTFICYSTASSTQEYPKFRILFKIKEYIPAQDIKAFWYALNSEIGFISDKQCKDLSRMYYIPANYKGAYNFFFTNDGKEINHHELIKAHPMPKESTGNKFFDRLPEELQKEVIEYRKNQMKNKEIFKWNTYSDCPFVNKTLIKEYKSIAYTDNSGRYAMIYKIMVSIASLAIKNEYPITTNEIVTLIRQIDMDTSNRYKNRALNVEADRAIEFAYKNI